LTVAIFNRVKFEIYLETRLTMTYKMGWSQIRKPCARTISRNALTITGKYH